MARRVVGFRKIQLGLNGLSGLDTADGHSGFKLALAWAAYAAELFGVGLLGGKHHAQQDDHRGDDLTLHALNDQAAHCFDAKLEAGSVETLLGGVRTDAHDATNLFHRQIGGSPQSGFKLARSQAHLKIALPVAGGESVGGHEVKLHAGVRWSKVNIMFIFGSTHFVYFHSVEKKPPLGGFSDRAFIQIQTLESSRQRQCLRFPNRRPYALLDTPD